MTFGHRINYGSVVSGLILGDEGDGAGCIVWGFINHQHNRYLDVGHDLDKSGDNWDFG